MDHRCQKGKSSQITIFTKLIVTPQITIFLKILIYWSFYVVHRVQEKKRGRRSSGFEQPQWYTDLAFIGQE